MTGSVDKKAFRDVCGRFATGVCVVTSLGLEGPSGMTANAVSSLSLEPPLMIVCFDRDSRTLAATRHSRRFAIHFLLQDQEPIAAMFASKRPEEEKFEGLGWTERAGTPILDDCLGWVACELRELHDGGDHLIGVGEAVEVWGSEEDPLVFYRGDYWALTGREPAPPEVDEALEP